MIDSMKRAEVALPSDREIVITRSFDAPKELVFEAWTKPEHVTHWWDPTRAPLERCEIDLRPGGAFRFQHRSHGGAGYVFSGTYREIAPPTRLVFTTPSPSGGETIGKVELSGSGEHTSLVVTMTCASKSDRDALLRVGVDAGTVQTLENLHDYLSS